MTLLEKIKHMNLGEMTKKAELSFDMTQKILEIVAENQKDIRQMLEDLHNFIEMQLEKEKKPDV